MISQKSSRVKFLEQCLSQQGFKMALKALRLTMKVMCKENGYVRHNGTDYYYHLVDVTQKLFNYGVRDENTLTAAILHDFVEDCYELGYTLTYVEHEFNSDVACIVDLVSKKPDVDYKQVENMKAYLSAISADWRAALVKAADRMHNFGTLGDATMEKKMKQVKETEEFFIPFFKFCRQEYAEWAGFFFEAKTQIEPHLREIREHYEEVAELKNKIARLDVCHDIPYKELI